MGHLLRTTLLGGFGYTIYWITTQAGMDLLRNKIDFNRDIDYNYTLASAGGWSVRLATQVEINMLPKLPIFKEHPLQAGQDLFSAGTLSRAAWVSLEVKGGYPGIAISDSLGIISYRRLIRTFEDPNTFMPINLFKSSYDIRFAQIRSLERNNFNVILKMFNQIQNDLPMQPVDKIPVETIKASSQ